MPRYFIELAYKGKNYSGFQVQENANTIQSEVEKAFNTIHRFAHPSVVEEAISDNSPHSIRFTGSSRTDAGVHALQNFFHFDFEGELHQHAVYKMNAILPVDIVVKSIYCVADEAHSRFDGLSRSYQYHIHTFKNPFLTDRSFFFPYKVDHELLNQAADIIKTNTNFWGFSKTNSQVKNFICTIHESKWVIEDQRLTYQITANRFLRGMVRLLTAAQLKLARNRLTISEFEKLFHGTSKCVYSVPAHGLYLESVNYPAGLLLGDT